MKIESEDEIMARVIQTLKVQNHRMPKKWEEMQFTNLQSESFDAESWRKILGLWRCAYDHELDKMLGFAISGPCGVGKTHVLASSLKLIAFRWFHHNRGRIDGQVQFWTFYDLCNYLREDPLDRKRIESVQEARFLFIDDLGTSKTTDFVSDKIFEIFDYRMSNDLCTFFTTNLNGDQLRKEYSERFTSRLKESFIWVEIKQAKDYRGNKYIENKKIFDRYMNGTNKI